MNALTDITAWLAAAPKKRRIAACAVFSLLTTAVMVAVFLFSNQSSGESSEISRGLLRKILDILPFEISHVFIRKAAHFSEFAVLGAMCFSAALLGMKAPPIPAALIISCAYAATDELHQIFIPGRACRFFDLFVDSSGAVCGIAAALLIFFIAYKIAVRKKK